MFEKMLIKKGLMPFFINKKLTNNNGLKRQKAMLAMLG